MEKSRDFFILQHIKNLIEYFIVVREANLVRKGEIIREKNESIRISKETRNNRDKFFLDTFGMSSIEFSMLDEDTQKKLIEEYHRERLQPQSKTAPVAFGTGEHLIFVEYEKGERVLTSNGYIIAGETLEENKKKMGRKRKKSF